MRTASMLSDGIHVTRATLEGLDGMTEQLVRGAMPVGSVEFVRHAMGLAGIPEPANLSYPEGCQAYTQRQVWRSTVAQALAMPGTRFIKSAQTKVFTGFVLDPQGVALSPHDQSQYEVLRSLAPDAPVWVSSPVRWVSEFRYYVKDGAVVGYARYDQEAPEEVPEPDREVVRRCIADLAIAHPYALDMGVMSTGETALVEVNDAWGLGLYGGAMKPLDYVLLLADRWASLRPVSQVDAA